MFACATSLFRRGLYRAGSAVNPYSMSSIDRGQSPFNSRDIARSASNRPFV
jgi:hypothetical protein